MAMVVDDDPLVRDADEADATTLWAILQEKRRVVRTLIDRVIIERVDGLQKRKITPIFALELPADVVSLASGHQSIEYIQDVGRV